MKREIKFRGKRIDTGEWVYGDLLQNGSITHISNFDNGVFRDHYEVDPETVGQFTGLTDKNGKEIYEGGIVNFEWSDKNDSEMIKHEVIFKDGEFRMKPMKSLMETWEIRISNYANQIEIIGNIHENPELIKP